MLFIYYQYLGAKIRYVTGAIYILLTLLCEEKVRDWWYYLTYYQDLWYLINYQSFVIEQKIRYIR